MKTWKLASRRLPCGADKDCWIADGAVYLEVKGQWVRALLRCEKHAGEPVGEIQREAIAPPKPRSDAKPMRWLARQAEQRIKRMTPQGDFDARRAAAGDKD